MNFLLSNFSNKTIIILPPFSLILVKYVDEIVARNSAPLMNHYCKEIVISCHAFLRKLSFLFF
jgi:hypothetical protein